MKLRELVRPRMLAGILLIIPLVSVAQTNPPGFDDLVLKATAARDRDDVPRSIELYQQALQLKPTWPDGWWFLGSLQYEADAYVAGRDALTHYLSLVPDAAPAFALRGLCEFETGEYPQSLADIQRGLSLGAAKQPRDEAVLRYDEALLLTRTGSFDAALQAYSLLARGGVPNKAPNKVPNPEVLVGIGLAGLRMPLLPKELAADKRELVATAGNAAFVFMSGDETAAQRAFETLFQRYPTAANAHYLYGTLLYPTDNDQAVAQFKRELEIDPSNAAAQLMVAWDSLMRNEFSTALSYAEKADAEEPALPATQLVLGRALVETGDLKRGIDLLRKELQLEPDNLEIHFALAKAYSKSGRKEDARNERLLCLQIEKTKTTQQVRR
jgi:tetratricopeptide (TPR) repeat protein